MKYSETLTLENGSTFTVRVDELDITIEVYDKLQSCTGHRIVASLHPTLGISGELANMMVLLERAKTLTSWGPMK